MISDAGFHALYWLLCEPFHRPVIRKAPLLHYRSDKLVSPAPQKTKIGPQATEGRYAVNWDWLEELGLGKYARRFAENGIDFSVLGHLSDQDLKDLGVLLGHRRASCRPRLPGFRARLCPFLCFWDR